MNVLSARTARAAGLAAACVLAFGLPAVPAALALDKPGTIQITNQETRHTHVDTGAPGRSVGDLDVYSAQLYNKRITPKSLGHMTMLCTSVSTSLQSCTATYFLPQGEIVVQGVIGSRLIYALAVVGGTGLYGNVRGTLTVTSLKRSPSRELLVFRLAV